MKQHNTNPSFSHYQVQWSSVASQTGIGAFGIQTDDLVTMEAIRACIRCLVLGPNASRTFRAKQALLKKFGLTIYFPRACAHMDTDLLIDVLRECNPVLKGTHYSAEITTIKNSNHASPICPTREIETIDCKTFKDSNPNIRSCCVKNYFFCGWPTVSGLTPSRQTFPSVSN